MIDIAAGQVWEDLDPRAKGRRVQVQQVGIDDVRVRVVANPTTPGAVGREVTIARKRFAPGARGYRRVSDGRVVVRWPRILVDGNIVVSTTGIDEAGVRAMANALEATL